MRGFNQSELFTKQLSQSWQLSYSTDFIIRNRNTTPQADLNNTERKTNLKNAFSISKKILKKGEAKPLENQNIILVDDVFTTGSTMQNCARLLKQLGVSKIWALTIAR